MRHHPLTMIIYALLISLAANAYGAEPSTSAEKSCAALVAQQEEDLSNLRKRLNRITNVTSPVAKKILHTLGLDFAERHKFDIAFKRQHCENQIQQLSNDLEQRRAISESETAAIIETFNHLQAEMKSGTDAEAARQRYEQVRLILSDKSNDLVDPSKRSRGQQ